MTNTIAKVSVIMPSYFTGLILLDAIASVFKQPHLHELILVDNGNSNYIRGKIEELILKHHNINVISGQGNVGFARACNLGSKVATGDYLLLLGPDCILPDNAFGKVICALEQDQNAWVAGCKLLNRNGNEQKNNRREILTFGNLLEQLSGTYTPPLPRQGSYVPAISSSFMFMRRDKYDEIGGLDKNYFLHIEDMDFCLQIDEMGGKIIYIYDLEVIHHGHTSDVSPIRVKTHIANSLSYYFRKNFSGAYPAGSIFLITALIYTHLSLWIASFIVKKNLKKLLGKSPKPIAMDHYVDFLGQYTDYETAPEVDVRDQKYYLTNRAPILITDVETAIGVCILRRLLAANVEVVAVYKDKPIDIYHPKLTWLQADLGNKNLEIPNDSKIKTVICTSPLYNLTPYIEKLTCFGLERLICFNPIAKLTKESDTTIRKHLSAEQDIKRICNHRKITFSFLHTPMVYGLSSNGSIKLIYKFIQRFGMFPQVQDVPEIYQPVHADDLAIAAIKILNIEQTYGQSYNLSGAEECISYNTIISIMFEVLQKQKHITSSRLLYWFFKLYNGKSINHEMARYSHNKDEDTYRKANQDFGYSAKPFVDITIEDLGI